jgi:hypothetical protein
MDTENNDDFQLVLRSKKKKQNGNISVKTGNLVASRTTTNSNVQQHDTGDQRQPTITTESTRFATSRYPFPPYITRFKANHAPINRFMGEITSHFKDKHHTNIEIVNCRLSKTKCGENEVDILLHLKDASSFATLHDQSKWPEKLLDTDYAFPSWPSLPPQLSIIMKNVNIHLESDEFTNEVKSLAPEIKNVIRMKNKFGNNIPLVKLELTSSVVRQRILDGKKADCRLHLLRSH